MDAHPGQDPPDGLTLTQPWSRGPAGKAVKETIYYQYRASRVRRTLRGIAEQVGKAECAVAGKIPVKRNRFITLTSAQKTVNRDLEVKALAGGKGYIMNLPKPTPEYVIGTYHQLWQSEKSFRVSKNDLRAKPIYHHLMESIQAHLAIVFAALATWNRPPAGALRSSSPRCAATAPFRSKPASTPSPPKTPRPTTPKTLSTSSTKTDNDRTNCHKSSQRGR